MTFNKNPQDAQQEKEPENRQNTHQSASVYLVNDAIEDFAKRGGFDDLKGMGKPLEIQEGDVLSGVMKNANYLPPWIELRKEIAAEMKRTMERWGHPDTPVTEPEIEFINEKIKLYNKKVPNPVLQKGFVSIENLEAKYENHWL